MDFAQVSRRLLLPRLTANSAKWPGKRSTPQCWLTVKGVTALPDVLQGVLVNPILVVHDFINMLDCETPNLLKTARASSSSRRCRPTRARPFTMKVRDHNKALCERKKENSKAPPSTLSVNEGRDQSGSRLLRQHRRRRARRQTRGHRRPPACLATAGVEPKTTAMRGGTDGSYLSSSRASSRRTSLTGRPTTSTSNCEFCPTRSPGKKSLAAALAIIRPDVARTPCG